MLFSLMNTISKIATTHSNTPAHKGADPSSPALTPSTKAHHNQPNVPPALTTNALAVPGNADNHNLGMSEQQLKRQGLESLVAVLRSLVTWGTATSTQKSVPDAQVGASNRLSMSSTKLDGMTSEVSLDKLSAPSATGNDASRVSSPEITDDPERFESAKQRKTILQDGIRRFASSPKKGIAFLLENGFIPSRTPVDIARFLLHTDGLNKSAIGEYLGEG